MNANSDSPSRAYSNDGISFMGEADPSQLDGPTEPGDGDEASGVIYDVEGNVQVFSRGSGSYDDRSIQDRVYSGFPTELLHHDQVLRITRDLSYETLQAHNGSRSLASNPTPFGYSQNPSATSEWAINDQVNLRSNPMSYGNPQTPTAPSYWIDDGRGALVFDVTTLDDLQVSAAVPAFPHPADRGAGSTRGSLFYSNPRPSPTTPMTHGPSRRRTESFVPSLAALSRSRAPPSLQKQDAGPSRRRTESFVPSLTALSRSRAPSYLQRQDALMSNRAHLPAFSPQSASKISGKSELLFSASASVSSMTERSSQPEALSLRAGKQQESGTNLPSKVEQQRIVKKFETSGALRASETSSSTKSRLQYIVDALRAPARPLDPNITGTVDNDLLPELRAVLRGPECWTRVNSRLELFSLGWDQLEQLHSKPFGLKLSFEASRSDGGACVCNLMHFCVEEHILWRSWGPEDELRSCPGARRPCHSGGRMLPPAAFASKRKHDGQRQSKVCLCCRGRNSLKTAAWRSKGSGSEPTPKRPRKTPKSSMNSGN